MKFQIGEKVVIHTPEVDLFVIGKVLESEHDSFKVQLSDGTIVIEPQSSELFEFLH